MTARRYWASLCKSRRANEARHDIPHLTRIPQHHYNIHNVSCTCNSQLSVYLVRNTLHRYISKQVTRASKPLPTPYQGVQAQTHPYSAPRPLQCFEQRHTRPRRMAPRERKSSCPDRPIQSNCKPHMGIEHVNSPMLTAAPPIPLHVFRHVICSPQRRLLLAADLPSKTRANTAQVPPRIRCLRYGAPLGLGVGEEGRGGKSKGGGGMLEGVNRARVLGVALKVL